MTTSFITTDVLILHRAGQAGLLPEGFTFRWRGHDLRHKPGGYTDGMSDPKFLQCVEALDPYGWILPAAVPHDGGYHRHIEIFAGGEWKPFQMDRASCDDMFYELALVLAGEDKIKQKLAFAFYEAVKLGGQSSYDEGHKPR